MRKFIKPRVTESFQGPKPKRSKTWEHLPLYGNKFDSQLEACFLNHTKKLDLPADWNNESPSKLWVYNLHYFEDLLSDNAEEKRNFHLELLGNWVDQNPVGYGNGWEPYPTSLRIVNILKAWLGGLELDEKLFSSVFAQASFLSSDLEKHLLGNHYFVNLKALLFAGVVFENIRWLSIAEKGLISEIPEQILEDGANFELSPMYHSLILVDMLDMFNLSMAYPTQVSGKLVSQLEYYIPKMLAFMEAMAHPDGGVSFFNDSADAIAPSKEKIESYAEKLGFKTDRLDLRKTKIIDNSKSGYICATASGNKLIFDTAALGPDYIPAHAHADTLSFELSLGKERVFVNSGTSEYGLGEFRRNQRKTKSHNTVEIDEKDSSQVWGGFRVANRARIIRKHYEMDSGNRILFVGEHDGYKKTFGGCIHSRSLNIGNNSLTVNDTISGKFKTATSYFYFHPDLHIHLEQNILNVNGSGFSMYSDLKGLKYLLSDSTYHPEFGITKKNKVLSINFTDSDIEVSFIWAPC
ncbi:heparinase II/III family protein [Porticoccaceae bacterium]|nr:heparinase II/III family protein [Porticoccaceae bacterium]